MHQAGQLSVCTVLTRRQRLWNCCCHCHCHTEGRGHLHVHVHPVYQLAPPGSRRRTSSGRGIVAVRRAQYAPRSWLRYRAFVLSTANCAETAAATCAINMDEKNGSLMVLQGGWVCMMGMHMHILVRLQTCDTPAAMIRKHSSAQQGGAPLRKLTRLSPWPRCATLLTQSRYSFPASMVASH